MTEHWKQIIFTLFLLSDQMRFWELALITWYFKSCDQGSTNGSASAINLMCLSFFGQHVNASPLPLFQAAPGFLSVGRRADRRTDDIPPAEKTPCEEKVYKKGHTTQNREGENLFVSPPPGQSV